MKRLHGFPGLWLGGSMRLPASHSVGGKEEAVPQRGEFGYSVGLFCHQ